MYFLYKIHTKTNLVRTWHFVQDSLNCEHSRKRTHRSSKLEQASLKLNPTRKQGFSGWTSLPLHRGFN